MTNGKYGRFHGHILRLYALHKLMRHFQLKYLIMSDKVIMTHFGPVTQVWGLGCQGGERGLGLVTWDTEYEELFTKMAQKTWPCLCRSLMTSPDSPPGPGQRRRGEPPWCGAQGPCDHRRRAYDGLRDHMMDPWVGAGQWRNADSRVNILKNPFGWKKKGKMNIIVRRLGW